MYLLLKASDPVHMGWSMIGRGRSTILAHDRACTVPTSATYIQRRLFSLILDQTTLWAGECKIVASRIIAICETILAVNELASETLLGIKVIDGNAEEKAARTITS